MATPFLGQISSYGFGFAPKGWALCNGQLLAINQNQALFSLLGTQYGGNGITTFALPNLQGAIAMGMGMMVIGQSGGEAAHTLTNAETPAHTHGVDVSTAPAQQTTAPPNNYPAVSTTAAYATGTPSATLGAGTASAGSGQPHNNMSPYLTINYCIALEGIYPSRS